MPYYVYILCGRSRNLYTGVTNNITRRVAEHKQGLVPGFTKIYRIERLVYVEPHGDIRAAIFREKHIKSWRREKRVALIERDNPAWDDLAAGWYPALAPGKIKYRSLVAQTPGSLGMTAHEYANYLQSE